MRRRVVAISLGVQIAFVFLAVSVFAWGIQAKLSLYNVAPQHGRVVAKLLTERNTSDVKASIRQTPADPPRLEDKLPQSSEVPPVFPVRIFEIQQIDAGLFRPASLSRWQVQSLHRPPPSLS